MRREDTAALLVVTVRDGGLERGLELAQRGQLLGCSRAHVENTTVAPTEDAERVECELEWRSGRRSGSQRVRRRRKLLLWHKRVEQVDVRRPAVQALVAEALSCLLDGQPHFLRWHERNRRGVELGIVGQRGCALHSRECGVTYCREEEPVHHPSSQCWSLRAGSARPPDPIVDGDGRRQADAQARSALRSLRNLRSLRSLESSRICRPCPQV